ncbi:MAG: cytochrome b [Proteobacteria bacterium]|nr:cytochrome b [Pseudomonadota bacterium]
MLQASQYKKLQIALHWVMFLLFAIALATIEYREGVPKETGQALRDTLRAIHISAGLLVFILAFVRIEERIRVGIPATLGNARWQIASAHLLHLALYIVMFALPITGVVFSQAGGRTVAFFGWELPQMLAQDPALRKSVKEVHEFLGNAVYVLVGLHVAASLWHHFIVKDDTLRRMLSWRGKQD